MRIAIVGLGGVGGYFGGKIAAAAAASGEDEVFFLVRGRHREAIAARGLVVKGREGEFTAKPALATEDAAEIGPVDFVLFCVKTYDLESAAAKMIPLVGEQTIILPLLNGVDHAKRLRAALPRGRVLNGCCYIFSMIESPGVISGGAGRIVYGVDSQPGLPEILPEELEAIAGLFRRSGIAAKHVANADVALWSKYLLICSLGGITSYYQAPVGAITGDPRRLAQLRAMMEEVEAVARAQGVPLPEAIVEETMKSVFSFGPDSTTSMQRDFEKGNRTELESFSGYIVRTGAELGVPTPTHGEVYAKLIGQSG
ncbi:2-dehydropantoate 2-reductase [Heliomicrobium modesticaldum Ice1]|uniref:2-dehydropantoate 2-reductase n=1 Tax=Heliobacterium modesticaldum (strain ATCC 51547 / Ice1) TaxID=498761 RepID=B0TDK5_HELMI|nr:2-dehydropantoate 2-reductase [Heliomicrobium modesticaldum]ABZ85530.1 2-dehydropantoate 2-reductase [Heliomicrobium modesticaldum Ice1]